MICAIILAAGQSRRMGVQKLLLPFGGQTVIAHIVDRLRQTALGGIHVIVGHEGERIAEALAGRPVVIVRNPQYKTGMLSTVRCGLKTLPEECEAVLVALGDQPAITSGLVEDMLQAYRQGGKGILVPCCNAKRGHPLLIARRFFGEILTQYDEVGLRGLLQAHPEEVLELDAATPAVLSDMDTPEDYRRELARLEDPSQ